MCGVAGIVRLDGGSVDPRTIEDLCEAIVHRGPDDGGFLVDGPVGLGVRRLKILDLSHTGHMPMTNEDGSIQIVYNGEIYNFKDIRRQLVSKGHVFRSTGDTEVVVHGYEEWGTDVLTRLNGIFGFALWDSRRRRTLIARDHLGVKPIYYHRNAERLAFASEIKALCRLPDVPRRPNRDALFEYLTFRYVAGEATLLKDVFTLLPGHRLVIEGGAVRDECYWDIDPAWETESGDEARVLEELSERVARSVEMQLVSDVPLGVQLSGGVDSSLITAIAARHRSQLGTYTISVDEPRMDEWPYARLVAERYGTEVHKFPLTPETFAERLPLLVWHLDEPLNHPNSVGIYELARGAKRTVTVLVSGEGGDEILGGYWHYQRALAARRLGPVAPIARWLARRPGILDTLPRRLRSAARLAGRSDDEDATAIYATAFSQPERVSRLFGLREDGALAWRRAQLARFRRLPLLERMMFLDVKTYLQSLLVRQDKMSMAASVETRVPLLDKDIVRFALPLPGSLKQRNAESKYLLKKIAEPLLPRELLYRTKMGFALPIGDWLSDARVLGRYMPMLTDSSSVLSGLLDPTGVARTIAEHGSAHDDSGESLLWSLLNLEIWARTFLTARPAPLPAIEVPAAHVRSNEPRRPATEAGHAETRTTSA